MKDEQKTRKDNAADEMAFSATRPSLSSLRRPSVVPSLRNQIGVDSDDSFCLTDQEQQQLAFKNFSESLRGYGLIVDDDSIDGGGGGGDHDSNDKNHEEGNEERRKEDTDKKARRDDVAMHAYHDGQKESFLSVLDEIHRIQDRARNDKGFSEWKFTWGLMNCLLIAYVFGSHPEHFWILYVTETIFWMSYKFRGMYSAKPLCEALYYLDFCWVMNTAGVVLMLAMIISDNYFPASDFPPVEWRKQFFTACFGVFCGPVFFASMTLPFVAFLFHDVNSTFLLLYLILVDT